VIEDHLEFGYASAIAERFAVRRLHLLQKAEAGVDDIRGTPIVIVHREGRLGCGPARRICRS